MNERNLTSTQPWEQALLPVPPLGSPRPRPCPSPNVSLCFPSGLPSVATCPLLCGPPSPAINVLLNPCSLFLSPALTWVTPQVPRQGGKRGPRSQIVAESDSKPPSPGRCARGSRRPG